MKLALKDVNEEDRGVIAPCGIICLGCDFHQDESLQAAKRIIEIWEGINLPDISGLVGLKAQEIIDTCDDLHLTMPVQYFPLSKEQKKLLERSMWERFKRWLNGC